MIDLREHTVYLRFSSAADLVADGRLLGALEVVEEALKTPFTHAQHLGVSRRDRPLAAVPDLSPLSALKGGGIHPSVKLKIFSTASPDQTPHVEIVAGAHPYTGTYRVSFDLRVPKSWFVQEGASARFADMMQNLVLTCEPFAAHAHDTDDNTMQNISDVGLLKRAFGEDAAALLLKGPEGGRFGREINLGERRYAVNWITVLGSEQVEALGEGFEHMQETPAAHVQRLEERWWVRLYGSPAEAWTEAGRRTQQAVFTHWGLSALAKREGPSFGYWDRKGRR